MDLYQIIITMIGYLFGAGGLVFWFLERRKFNAEVAATLESVQATKIENDVKLSEHYREILDDLKKRYEDRYQEYETMMNNKIRILKDEITLLRKQVKSLKGELKEKEERIKELSVK
ncbi:MAG: DUF5320 domain-containing protein [Flavobacteriaceae bacterium]|jgi:polyhydroxyalkanoate synthesis regulator phasin|nr:DUF5320 domain-containing protein [Flavobacteriaceae bacterium]